MNSKKMLVVLTGVAVVSYAGTVLARSIPNVDAFFVEQIDWRLALTLQFLEQNVWGALAAGVTSAGVALNQINKAKNETDQVKAQSASIVGNIQNKTFTQIEESSQRATEAEQRASTAANNLQSTATNLNSTNQLLQTRIDQLIIANKRIADLESQLSQIQRQLA